MHNKINRKVQTIFPLKTKVPWLEASSSAFLLNSKPDTDTRFSGLMPTFFNNDKYYEIILILK